MTAAIIPFPNRQADAARAERETLMQTRRLIAECWLLRAECARIRRDYEARRGRIEARLDGIR